MRLKSFQAKSMSEVLRQVKDTLGEDAIIVSTKEGPGGWVRITAAVEQENPLPLQKKQAEKPPRAEKKTAARSYAADDVADHITDTLLRHRVPASVSDRIISAAAISAAASPREVLAEALASVFTFEKQVAGKKSRQPLVLVGPPGAGKTLMTAKLAARAVLEGRKPAVITTDIARAGGVEQLEAFLDILSLPLQQAEDVKTLKSCLAKVQHASEIIIDTGGLNPFDPKEMKELAKILAVDDMRASLVLPAGIDAEESAEMAMTFGVLGVKNLIPTRLDFARRLGGILSAAARANLSFQEASHTPQVADGIIGLSPETLAQMLIPDAQNTDTARKR